MGMKDYYRKKRIEKKQFQQKRTNWVQKAWYILKPFLEYTILKSIAMVFASLVISTLGGDKQAWVLAHSNQVSAVINALASVYAVWFVLREFFIEVDLDGEYNIDDSTGKQWIQWMRLGVKEMPKKWKTWGLSAVAGIATASFFNGIILQCNPYMGKYEQVEQIQYSVPIWLGVILYGLISPVVEEIVFRGITYNRMRRFFHLPVCILASALIFGGFHGNLQQFLYGTCMGILLAVIYEWTGSFGGAIVFHMAANLFVFIISASKLQSIFMSPAGMVITAVLAFMSLWILIKHKK